MVALPSHGSLAGTAPHLTYSPVKDYHGGDSFTFRVSDGRLESAEATISIEVRSVNDAPRAALSLPAAGAQFVPPIGIDLEAMATDVDGTISLVEFFADGTRLGEASASPYRLSWEGAPVGHASLTAKATDDQGLISGSAAVEVDVLAALGSAEVLPDGSFQVTLVGEPSREYVIEVSDDLAAWTPLRTEPVSAEGVLRFRDQMDAASGQRFYRATLVLLP